eukprot:gene20785-21491_t
MDYDQDFSWAHLEALSLVEKLGSMKVLQMVEKSVGYWVAIWAACLEGTQVARRVSSSEYSTEVWKALYWVQEKEHGLVVVMDTVWDNTMDCFRGNDWAAWKAN